MPARAPLGAALAIPTARRVASDGERVQLQEDDDLLVVAVIAHLTLLLT